MSAHERPASDAFGERLSVAMHEHQEGRIAEAERAYRTLLDEHPDDANATHFRGMLRFHAGEVEEGIGLVRRSVAADPPTRMPGTTWATCAMGVMRMVARTSRGSCAKRVSTGPPPTPWCSGRNWGNRCGAISSPAAVALDET